MDDPLPAIIHYDHDGDVEASYQQRVDWELRYQFGGPTNWTFPRVWWVDGELDVDRFRAAFYSVIRRQQALRTTFHEAGGTVVARVHEVETIPLEKFFSYYEVPKGVSAEAARSFVRAHAEELCVANQDPEHLPLIESRVIRVSDTRHAVLIEAHHILVDGDFHGILWSELDAFYAAHLARREPQLPAIRVEHLDYCKWWRSLVDEGHLEADRAYWRDWFAGAGPASIPIREGARRAEVYRGTCLVFPLPKHAADGFDSVANAAGATLFNVATAISAVIFAELAGCRDVTILSTVTMRLREPLQGVLGDFRNDFGVRVHLVDGDSFLDVVARAKAAMREGLVHRLFPFAESPLGLVGRRPYRQLRTSVEDRRSSVGRPLEALPGLYRTFDEFRDSRVGLSDLVCEYELTLDFDLHQDVDLLIIEYASELFDREFITALAERVRTFMLGIFEDPASCVVGGRRGSVQRESKREDETLPAGNPRSRSS